MDSFTKRMKRKFSALSKPKAFRSRSAKLRQIQRDAEEDLSSNVPFSPDSVATGQVSQNGGDFDTPADEVDDQKSQPNSPDHETKVRDFATSLASQANGEFDQTSGQHEQLVDAEKLSSEEGQAHSNQEDTDGMFQGDPMDEAQLSPQEQRNIIYLVFNGEDETDYTEGPARMAFASDGVKDTCGSLLMTLNLSQAIQRAIEAERAFAKAERAAERKRQVYLNFRSDLNAEIANHKLRLSQEQGADDESQKHSLQQELANLELMLEENSIHQQRIDNDLQYKARVLRDIQGDANAMIEEAFVCAQLLAPVDDTPDTPIEDLDLQKEYQAFTAPSEAGSASTVVATTLDTSRDHMFAPQPELTEDQQRQLDVKRALYDAQERLQSAQAAFDRREQDRADERVANEEAAVQGYEPNDATPEEFDLRWVQRIHELTRELIEAESAYSAAKTAATAVGIDIPMDDCASGFVDDVADGYRMSMEQAMIGSVPSPKIKDWMSGIPEAASPSFNGQTQDKSEWEADEVQISDSISMVAVDADERKRIDKWRRVCGLE